MPLRTIVKRNPIAISMAVAAAAAMVLVSEASYRQSADTLTELGEIVTARTSVRELALGLVDAETGQRGYLLTDHEELLEPYEKALEKIDESFKELDRYYADQPALAEPLAKLHTLAEAKLSELALTIRLHQEGKAEAAKQIVTSGIGNERMGAIRALVAELLDHENHNVATGRSDLFQTLILSRVGMAALSVISLLALFLYLRHLFVLELQQRELKRVVQAERDRLEVEVGLRTAQLTELTDHLQTAREDERNRLARNLHDELGALLTSAKLDAARIKPRLAGVAPEALERLNHLVGTLNTSIALGRRIIEDLRPSTLSNLGLVATLEILAREFAERSGVQVHCALAPVKLEATTELVIYRLVQEAITNITKYARARNVWLSLAAENGQVEVSVRDDGIGFDTASKPASAYGLLGMRFRVESEGGTLALVSAPGQGTLIRVRLPESTAATA